MFALAVGMPGKASALPSSTYSMICNSCGNPVIQQRLREEYGNYTRQYVLDFDRGTIRFFERMADRTWREIPVADAERNYFNVLREFWSKNGGSLLYVDRQQITGTRTNLALRELSADAKVHAVPLASGDLDSVSAWDVVYAGNYRNNVADELKANMSTLWSRIATNTQMSVGSVRTLFGVDNPADVRVGVRELAAQVEVTFKDGSRANFAWNPYAKTFEYVPRSSRDSDNNTIPDTPDDVTGGQNGAIYVFSGTPTGVNNSIRFYQRVTSFGVQTPSPTAPAVIACTQVSGGPRVCRLQQ